MIQSILSAWAAISLATAPVQPIVDACTEGVCVIPAGIYDGPLTIRRRQKIEAWAVDIRVPAGSDGLVLEPASQGSSIEGMSLSMVGTSSVPGRGTGVTQRAGRIHLSDLIVARFGRGWVCDTRDGKGSCNGSWLERVSIHRTDLEGVLIAGGDANAIATMGIDVKQACWRAPEGYPCAGIIDLGFLGNTHFSPIIHSVYTGGLAKPYRKYPSWRTGSDNAWTSMIGPYCEGDSAPPLATALTTILAGNCTPQRYTGMLIRPMSPTIASARYGGPLVLGGASPTAPRVRIGVGTTAPKTSRLEDEWKPGDLWIYVGLTPAGGCKILEVASVDATTGAIATRCSR
jgi:hypothetical protein